MLIFAGLGNPGAQHAEDRHNIGFMAADAIAQAHRFSPPKQHFQCEAREGRIGLEKILLLKPQTYMNLSGQAVGEAMRYYKLRPADVVVFYDELDLAPGKVKVRVGGGAAGHNGIRSLIAHLGSPDFVRVRIGIGHPGAKELVQRHVLGPFSKADRAWVTPLCEAIATHAPRLAERDWPRFLTDLARDRPA